MNRLFNLCRLLNALSIDVATGAVVGSLYLAYVLHVKPAVEDLICLGLTVWLIYTADHLLDAKKIKRPAATYRHRVHQLYYNVLLGAASAVVVILFLLLFMLKQSTLIGGAGLALLVILYFAAQQRLGLLKELVAAVLYAGGVALPVLTLSGSALSLVQIFVMIAWATTALVNLVLFSWFDYEHDGQDNHPSLARRLGVAGTKNILYFLFLFQFGLAGYSMAFFSNSTPFMGTLLMMNGALLMIFIKWRWFAGEDKYRLAGDAVFLFPVFYLLF